MDFGRSNSKRSRKANKRKYASMVPPESEIETAGLDHEKESNVENVTGRFVCDQCKKVLFSTKAITIHKAKYHKRQKKSSDGSIIIHCELCKQEVCLLPTTKDISIDMLVCSKCKTTLYQPTDGNSTKPLKKDDEKNSLECVDCGRWFDSWRGMTMHIRMHEHENDNDIVQYMCNICDNTYLILSDFLKHFQTHGEKPLKGKDLKCEYCNVAFSKVDKYITHVKTHAEHDASDKKIMLKCCQPICNAIFLTKESFENHQYMHQYLRYKCNLCQKLFTSSRSLNRHCKICASTPK